MAPRGRKPKKNDNTRMEAAIQTMHTEYGITDVELIKKVVNQLLEAYDGGEEAWYFIELYTYQELFEGIVRFREENPEENNLLVNYAGGGDSEDNSLKVATAENHAPENAAGSSSEPICSEVADRGLLKYKDDTDFLPVPEMDGKGWKDIGLDLSSSHRDSRNAVCEKEENSGSNKEINTGSLSHAAQLIPTTSLAGSVASQMVTSPLLLSPSLVTTDSSPVQRRPPCYGWIEDDDEEDIDDFIDLKPAKTAARRRSRWDLRPADP